MPVPGATMPGEALPFYAPAGSYSGTLFHAALFGFGNNFYPAYALGFINTAAETLKQYINESYVARGQPAGLSNSELLWLWDVILNASYIGWFLGNFFTPILNDGLGRKYTLIIGNLGILTMNVLNTISVPLKLPELFLFSSIMAFAFSTVNYAAMTAMLLECPAPPYRGTGIFIAGTMFTAGTLIGMICGTDALLGRRPFALVGVSAFFVAVSTAHALWTRESPKFLLLMRNDQPRALESLVFYQGTNVNHQRVIDEILMEDDQADRGRMKGEGANITARAKELLLRNHLRNGIILGLVALHVIVFYLADIGKWLGLIKLTVGVWPITTELLSAHFDLSTAQFYSTSMYAVNFLAGVVGIYTIQKMRRRTLLIGTSLLNVSALALYTLFDRLAKWVWLPFRYAALASMAFYNFAFGIGLGTIAYYIAGELLPQRYRSTGQAVVFNLNLIFDFGFMFFTLPAYVHYDVWAFIPLFIVPGFACVLYLWRYMPETGNREVHEVIEELKLRHGKRARRKVAPTTAVYSNRERKE